MTIKEVKRGLIARLQTIFPKNEYKFYNMAVVEKYDRPCFFVQLKATDTSLVNYNFRNMNAALYIDYFGKTANESEAIDVIQKIMDEFAIVVKIGAHTVYVENVDWDFIGTEKNHLQMSIDLQWMTRIEHLVDEPVMESVKIKTKLED